MVASPRKKPPTPEQMAFIELARKMKVGKPVSDHDIAALTPSWLREVALQLRGRQELEYIRIWDALETERKPLQDWRDLVMNVPAGEAGSVPSERTYQLHPISYLKDRPKREWAVQHLIYESGGTVFFGDGGSGKSTFVLDMNLARACEMEFLGRPVKKAFVIWVAAESIDDLYPRISAYLKCHQIPEASLTNFLVLDGRVPLNNVAEVELFIAEVKDQLGERGVLPGPDSLSFVFDTYARCTPGADENSTQETKGIADTILSVSKAFQAHVTIIHHASAQGRLRGNTALRDALDTAWLVTKDGDLLKLHCDKMRGNREPEDFYAEMRSIVLDDHNVDDTAPVIFSTHMPSQQMVTPKVQLQMLEVLETHGTLTCNEWARRCHAAYGIAESTFQSHLKLLVQNQYASCPKPEERIKGKKVPYTISEKGRALLNE